MSTPQFVDAAFAAENLGISPDVILDWIAHGRLKTYGGRASNPFVRSADVQAVADEVGVERPEEAGKRVRSPASRVQTRLTADAKWGDIQPEDIREWVRRADPARRQAARTAATAAAEKLQVLLAELEQASLME